MRAVVIKTYGDVEFSDAIVDGMTRHMIPINVTELSIIRDEVSRMKDVPLRRAVKGPKTPPRARRRKYTTEPQGRLFGAILGVYGLCVLCVARLSAWNQR